MCLKGLAESGGVLRGKLSGLKTIHGYSAYEVAVINGFKGTEEEWLESLKGDTGKSAYEIAVEGGYEGTEQEFYADLANFEKLVQDAEEAAGRAEAKFAIFGGGETGDILMKIGDEDYAFGWTKDAGGLTVELRKAVGVEKIPADAMNMYVASTLLSFWLNRPEGYDRVRINSLSIPARDGTTVRFAACSYADGKMTVDAVLGETTAADGWADLTLTKAYDAPSSVYLAAFADSADIAVLDVFGTVTDGVQFADNGIHSVSVGMEFALADEVKYLAIGAWDAYAYQSARSLREIQVENHDRLTALENTEIPSGANGVGIESVTQTTTSTEDGGENIITVTLTDGTESTFSVRNGGKGSTGASPVKGTDYWTDEDKAEMVSEVLAAMPVAEGASF